MKIMTNLPLNRFEFWGKARGLAKNLRPSEMDQVEKMLEGMYPDGIDEDKLNDLFANHADDVAKMIGCPSAEFIEERDHAGYLINFVAELMFGVMEDLHPKYSFETPSVEAFLEENEYSMEDFVAGKWQEYDPDMDENTLEAMRLEMTHDFLMEEISPLRKGLISYAAKEYADKFLTDYEDKVRYSISKNIQDALNRCDGFSMPYEMELE